MKRLKNSSFILFGGSADVDDDNIRALLHQNLPEDMGACIQAEIPARGYRGLKKVRAWLEEQFKEDEIELTEDMTAYVENLDDTKDVYLVVLWTPDNKDTEELVSAAQGKGIPVLDLADGMEELKLAGKDDQKEPEPAASRSSRRSRRAQAAAEDSSRPAIAAVPDTSEQAAPWEPDTPPDDFGPDVLAAAHALGLALGHAVEAAATGFLAKFTEAADEQAQAAAPEPAGTRPPGTKPWLQNPKVPDELKPKGRGRPRGETIGWNTIYLTAAQEKALGLSDG